ncbi:hypothetical protein Hanom_Chr16g01506881 [Helianthus anomalus]
MDYHVLNSTKRKKSLFINFLPNTQNRFIAISKHNNQIIRLKTQSQTPSKYTIVSCCVLINLSHVSFQKHLFDPLVLSFPQCRKFHNVHREWTHLGISKWY